MNAPRHGSLLDLLGRASAALVDLRLEHADVGLTRLLELLVQELGAGSASLYRIDLARRSVVKLARYGAFEAPDWAYSFAAWPDGVARVMQGTPFAFSVDELPHEPAEGRQKLAELGIAWGLIVPMALQDRVWGTMAFWWGGGERPDTSATEALRPVATLVAHTLRWLEAETERRRIEGWFRLQEAVGSEALGLHAEGRFLDANEAAQRLLRTTREALVGRSVFDLVHPNDRPTVARRIAEGVEGAAEVRVLRPDGSVFWAEVEARQAQLEDQVVRVIAVRDISERVRAREMEAAARQAQKLESIGVLAGGIAHDFNNLLVGVMGNAELILACDGLDDEVSNAAEQIRDAGLRARELTSQLQVYAGTASTNVEPVDLNARIRSLLPLLSVAGRCKDIHLALQPEVPALMADGAQMDQLVMNLVTNAVEATEGAGLVRVHTRLDHVPNFANGEQHLVLEVSDDGPGMCEEVRRRAFDPFYSTKGDGRGLGLAAVYGVVKHHGGSIEIDSASQGGVSMRVRLPLLVAGPTRKTPPQRPAVRLEGARALVVDDESIVRRAVARLMARLGMDVAWQAAGGVEALDLVEAHADAIDVVLLDVSMPVVDGYAVLEKIRSRRKDVPVVLSSGDALRDGYDEDRYVYWLPKPYLLDQLVEVMTRALGPKS